jgi:hypothetical protein
MIAWVVAGVATFAICVFCLDRTRSFEGTRWDELGSGRKIAYSLPSLPALVAAAAVGAYAAIFIAALGIIIGIVVLGLYFFAGGTSQSRENDKIERSVREGVRKGIDDARR